MEKHQAQRIDHVASTFTGQI